MGFLELMFGSSGGSAAKESSDEEKALILKKREGEIQEAEYREVSSEPERKRRASLASLMWGGGSESERELRIRTEATPLQYEQYKEKVKKQKAKAKVSNAFQQGYNQQIILESERAGKRKAAREYGTRYFTKEASRRKYEDAQARMHAFQDFGGYNLTYMQEVAKQRARTRVRGESRRGHDISPFFVPFGALPASGSRRRRSKVHPWASFGFTY